MIQTGIFENVILDGFSYCVRATWEYEWELDERRYPDQAPNDPELTNLEVIDISAEAYTLDGEFLYWQENPDILDKLAKKVENLITGADCPVL